MAEIEPTGGCRLSGKRIQKRTLIRLEALAAIDRNQLLGRTVTVTVGHGSLKVFIGHSGVRWVVGPVIQNDG